MTTNKAHEIRHRFAMQSPLTPARTQFYEAMRLCIMDGVFEAGDVVSEVDLAKHLGISRTPIREGLQRLEAEGWLSRGSGRGLIVRRVTEGDLSVLYQMRSVLEALALRIGVPVRPGYEDSIKRLGWLVHEMEMHTKHDNHEAVAEKNREFHQLLVSLCGSKVLINQLQLVYDQLDRVRENGGLWAKGRLEEALKEHVELYEAVRDGDKQKAARCVEQHIMRAGEAVLASLRSEQSSKHS